MLVKDKSFYKTFVGLAVALMLEQAVILSVNLVDNIMLGTYSESALAGVAAVNQIQFVYQQLVYAIGTGLITLGSQYWGQNRPERVKTVFSVAVYAEIAIALILFTLTSLFPEGAVGLFTGSPQIIGEGVKYLRVMRLSYFFFAMTAVMLSSMRIVGQVKIALLSSVLSLITNVTINYLLIKGRLGFPEMGATGAAIGTLAARILEFLVVGTFVLRDKKLKMRFKDLLRVDGVMAKDFIKVALPILGASGLWGVTNAMQTIILGHMNDSAIAAQSISNTVFLLLKVTSVGASSAASVIIGRAVGIGDMDKIKSYAKTLQVIFVGIGAVLCGIMLLIRVPILNIYKAEITKETYELAGIYMYIQAVVLFTMSYQMPTNTGIIRGGGDTKYVLWLDIIASFTFIPIAYIGGLYLNWSAVAVIIVVNVDQCLKAIPAYIRCNGFRWVRNLTRDD